jgi:hypothetical protein
MLSVKVYDDFGEHFSGGKMRLIGREICSLFCNFLLFYDVTLAAEVMLH